jgi:hypothetical protein
MKITPQACRRIADAVQVLSDVRSRERWGAWARERVPEVIRTDVPYDVAAIALEALTTAERNIQERLAKEGLDEDIEADLLNDLGFVQAIETTLRQEGIER